MHSIVVKCSECKTKFERSPKSNKATCSPECKRKRKIRLQSERRRKTKMADAATHCANCGGPLNPSRFTAQYCSKRECQLARKRKNNEAALERYAAIMRAEGKRKCPHCGDWHVRSEAYATCGKERCVAAQVRARKAEQGRRRAERLRIAADEKAAAIAKQQQEAARYAEIERKISATQCQFRGPWQDDKGRKWPAMKTNIPGLTWDDPIMDPMTMRVVADGVWFETGETETKRRKAA